MSVDNTTYIPVFMQLLGYAQGVKIIPSDKSPTNHMHVVGLLVRADNWLVFFIANVLLLYKQPHTQHVWIY